MESQLDVSVTVHSLAGDILFETEVSSIQELEDESARKLHAKKCHMVSADGAIISDDFQLHHLKHPRLTAVAQNVSPLLQLLGLQNAQGDVDQTYQTVPIKQLEQAALEGATMLARTACWFGTASHIGGSSWIPWKNGRLTVEGSTAVIPRGHLVYTAVLSQDMPCPVSSIRATREMTVDDIIKIRSNHQAECEKNKSKLLAKHPGADALEAMICLVQYTAEAVFFELGHRAYKLPEIF